MSCWHQRSSAATNKILEFDCRRPLNAGLATAQRQREGRSGMAATRGNDDVDDKLLKEEEVNN